MPRNNHSSISTNMRYLSPLRYPGGKAQLANFLRLVFEANGLVGGAYAEPYAGGAGAALALLFSGHAASIHINDIDPAIHSFWFSVLNETENLCRLIQKTRVIPSEWERQRRIYANGGTETPLALGFAAFFLNRTNRSGIIDSGSMIGGRDQSGQWKLDARYNRQGLISRIELIARHRKQIHLSSLDAVDFLKHLTRTLPTRSLVYLDPPYFTNGRRLYANYYERQDHAKLAELLSTLPFRWLVSYDNVPVIRRLYGRHWSMTYTMHYTAAERKQGIEAMFFSPGLAVPPKIHWALNGERARHAAGVPVSETKPYRHLIPIKKRLKGGRGEYASYCCEGPSSVADSRRIRWLRHS